MIIIAYLSATVYGQADSSLASVPDEETPVIELDLSASSSKLDPQTTQVISSATTVEELRPFFKSDDVDILRTAMEHSRRKNLVGTVPDIASILDQKELESIWPDAVELLSDFDATKYTAKIEGVALASSAQTRLHSLKALTKLNSPNLLRFLVRGIRDSDKRVQHYALERISGFWSEELTYHLLTQYLREDDREIRTQILTTISLAWPSSSGESLLQQQRIAGEILDNAKNASRSRVSVARRSLFPEKRK